MSGFVRAADVDRVAAEFRAYVDAAIARVRAEAAHDLRVGLEGVMAHVQGWHDEHEAVASRRAARRSGVPDVAVDLGASYRGRVDRIDAEVMALQTRVATIERGLAEMVRGGS